MREVFNELIAMSVQCRERFGVAPVPPLGFLPFLPTRFLEFTTPMDAKGLRKHWALLTDLLMSLETSVQERRRL